MFEISKDESIGSFQILDAVPTTSFAEASHGFKQGLSLTSSPLEQTKEKSPPAKNSFIQNPKIRKKSKRSHNLLFGADRLVQKIAIIPYPAFIKSFGNKKLEAACDIIMLTR